MKKSVVRGNTFSKERGTDIYCCRISYVVPARPSGKDKLEASRTFGNNGK